MKNIVITSFCGTNAIISFENNRAEDITVIQPTGEHLHNVYIGKVSKIIKNIDAAFVDISKEITCFLPLKCIDKFIITNRVADGSIRTGDELAVQLVKASVKDKRPVCSGVIRIPGVRTEDIVEKANSRTLYSCIYSSQSEFLSIFDKLEDIDKITCDVWDIFEVLDGYLAEHFPNFRSKLSFYNDEYPLSKLYKLESLRDEILGKIVWLRCGGNIVIENTEACTIIDVNSAKSIDQKSVNQKLITNIQAADEAMRQIRLRGISGMILIDFINMSEDDTNSLVEHVIELCHKEKIKTNYIDITGLGIVEITRKKVQTPIMDIINRN